MGIKEIQEGMADFENRLSYLEALHTSSNAHIINQDPTFIDRNIEMSEVRIETTESLLKCIDNLEKELRGRNKYYMDKLNTLSEKIEKQYSKSKS